MKFSLAILSLQLGLGSLVSAAQQGETKLRVMPALTRYQRVILEVFPE